jgi:hypothetical protein
MGLFKSKKEKQIEAEKKAIEEGQAAEDKMAKAFNEAESKNLPIPSNNDEVPEYEQIDSTIPLTNGFFNIDGEVEKSIKTADVIFKESQVQVKKYNEDLKACEERNNQIKQQKAIIKAKHKELEGVFHQLDQFEQINDRYIKIFKSQEKMIADIPNIVRKK